jgi:hypothetical protein
MTESKYPFDKWDNYEFGDKKTQTQDLETFNREKKISKNKFIFISNWFLYVQHIVRCLANHNLENSSRTRTIFVFIFIDKRLIETSG